MFEGFDVGGLQEGICEVELTDANGCVSSDMFGLKLLACQTWIWDLTSLAVPVMRSHSSLRCKPICPTSGVQGRQVRFWFWMLRIGTLVVGVEVTDDAGCTASDAVILTLDDCTSSIEQAAPNRHSMSTLIRLLTR